MRDCRITPRNDSFFSSLIKDSLKINKSFKTDPSLATSARAANESGSYLCGSNVTPTVVRFIVSVFLCLLCSCRMSSTQMTCSHFRKNRPKKRQKPAGCRSRIISKNRPVPIFGRSTGASLLSLAVLGCQTIVIHYSHVSSDSLIARGRPIIGADIKHFTDYRYRPF